MENARATYCHNENSRLEVSFEKFRQRTDRAMRPGTRSGAPFISDASFRLSTTFTIGHEEIKRHDEYPKEAVRWWKRQISNLSRSFSTNERSQSHLLISCSTRVYLPPLSHFLIRFPTIFFPSNSSGASSPRNTDRPRGERRFIRAWCSPIGCTNWRSPICRPYRTSRLARTWNGRTSVTADCEARLPTSWCLT